MRPPVATSPVFRTGSRLGRRIRQKQKDDTVTHPYMIEKLAAARREDLLSEAERHGLLRGGTKVSSANVNADTESRRRALGLMRQRCWWTATRWLRRSSFLLSSRASNHRDNASCHGSHLRFGAAHSARCLKAPDPLLWKAQSYSRRILKPSETETTRMTIQKVSSEATEPASHRDR